MSRPVYWNSTDDEVIYAAQEYSSACVKEGREVGPIIYVQLMCQVRDDHPDTAMVDYRTRGGPKVTRFNRVIPIPSGAKL